MEVIKKITIVAVLIASVMLIISLFDDTFPGVKEYADTKKSEILKNWEERRLERQEEARWNSLTQAEKCEERTAYFKNFTNERIADGSYVDGEWQDETWKSIHKAWKNVASEECKVDVVCDWAREYKNFPELSEHTLVCN